MAVDEITPWGKNFVAEVLDDGKVVVWPDETEEMAAEFVENFNHLSRNYFLVDITLTPSSEVHP